MEHKCQISKDVQAAFEFDIVSLFAHFMQLAMEDELRAHGHFMKLSEQIRRDHKNMSVFASSSACSLAFARSDLFIGLVDTTASSLYRKTQTLSARSRPCSPITALLVRPVDFYIVA